MIHIKQGLLFTLAGIVFAQILYWFAKWCDDNDNDR